MGIIIDQIKFWWYILREKMRLKKNKSKNDVVVVE